MIAGADFALFALAMLGVVLIAFGLLDAFAAGMATAPKPGAGRGGCIVALLGLALLVIALVEGIR